MGAYIAQRLVCMLGAGEKPLKDAKNGILGVTFKENVPDIRNSRVPDIARELRHFGISPLVHDPLAQRAEVRHEYRLDLCALEALDGCDALILAVPHAEYLQRLDAIWPLIGRSGTLVDIKSRRESRAGTGQRPVLEPLSSPGENIADSLNPGPLGHGFRAFLAQ